MKIFDSSKPKGTFSFEALTDCFTHDQLTLLENKKAVREVNYKVKDDETIVIYVTYDKCIDVD